jgi:hypothetical protein
MQAVLLGLAALACPAGMGLMWMMMRGHGTNSAQAGDPTSQQVDELRVEIDRLKAERAAHRPADGP